MRTAASGRAARTASAMRSRLALSLYVGRTTHTPRPAARPTDGSVAAGSAADADIRDSGPVERLALESVPAVDEQLEPGQHGGGERTVTPVGRPEGSPPGPDAGGRALRL